MLAANTLKEKPVLRLAIPSPLRRIFDYWPPAGSNSNDWEALTPGMRLLVPFGKRRVVGVLLEIETSSEIDQRKIRCAISVLDEKPLFSNALMQVFLWAARYYQHPPGDVFSAILPPRLRRIPTATGFGTKLWEVVNQPPIVPLSNRAHRQQALLQLLLERGPLSQTNIEAAGFNPALLKQLETSGHISKRIMPVPNSNSEQAKEHRETGAAAEPNENQQKAISALANALGQFGCFLLDGVTGSGKTEVYLQVIERVIANGSQALVLVPEIGLTPQTISRFRERFNCELAILHSGLNETERYNNWYKAYKGEAAIVIGTRSAIFTPLKNPGLIVVDEEHDLSFKQQEGFRYSARDLAIVRGREENVPVILGSATPALESLHNALSGKFVHLVLPERAGAAEKPIIRLEDISCSELLNGFSVRLTALLQSTLESGNQALVFINRRGFAPALYCCDCGWVFECNRCDVQLTVHRNPPLLRCHHCELQLAIPRSCSQCGSKKLATRGMGTEKTELFLQQRFTGFPVIRMDRDSTRRKDSLQAILRQVESGKPCILVGTQMLAKGHHFPNVTLVAVLDADAGLFSPDFRGQEQMVQLLFQVAGRAGRASRPGEVIIQTRHPAHPILQSLIRQDYHATAGLLLEDRRSASMPPFSHLALYRAEAGDIRLPAEFLQEIRNMLEQSGKNRSGSARTVVSGPVPAPMERKAGRYRMQLLLQAGNRTSLQSLLAAVTPEIEQLKLAKKVRWSVDVDPLDLI
ncbi:MAG: primosomal protein N' [Pseudohongiellaceae bacterium]